MNIALATRKALIAAVFVPVIAMTAVSVEPAAGLSGAEAQQAAGRGGNNGGGNRGGEGRGENPYLLLQGECPPGVATHVIDCQPPRRPVEMTEAHDCSCEVYYRITGGQRVAVRDCYFEMNNEIRYCHSDQIRLR